MSGKTRTQIGKSGAVALVAAALAISPRRDERSRPCCVPRPWSNIPAGEYLPFFQESPGKGKARVENAPVRMNAFRLDALPVTNGQYLEFVRDRPEWRRSRVKPLFADIRYLAHWRGDLELADEKAASEPVTNVSWFAAEAYCEARGSAAAPDGSMGIRARRSGPQAEPKSNSSRSTGSARQIPSD